MEEEGGPCGRRATKEQKVITTTKSKTNEEEERKKGRNASPIRVCSIFFFLASLRHVQWHTPSLSMYAIPLLILRPAAPPV